MIPRPKLAIPWLILLVWGLGACQSGQPSPLAAPSLPQDPAIQVYFNQASATEYTEPYRQQTRSGDDFEQRIVTAIASAQSTVDVAVQELRLPKIAQALAERHRAGVKVRVILENNYSRSISSVSPQEVAKMSQRERDRHEEGLKLIDLNGDGQISTAEMNQRDALVILNNAQVPWIDDTADGSKGSNLMHHKFIVVDGRTLIITSANFTLSDLQGDFRHPRSRGNANNLLQVQSPDLAALFTQEFDWMWGDGPKGKPDSRFGIRKPFRPAQSIPLGAGTVTVQFSPASRSIPWAQSSNGLIGKTLAGATRSVELALFVFSEQAIANILQTVHQQGVPVRAVLDSSFIYRPFSEGLDMLGVSLADENCRYQPQNQPWAVPITTVGVPLLAPGDLLHHKFAVVDQQVVIAGSHNWSAAANQGNDETLLVIHNPTVAAHFTQEFERLYRDATTGIPPGLQRKLDTQQQTCPPPIAATSSPQKTTNRPSGRINLNTASPRELATLPGIGPGLAQRIVQARQQKPFTALSDLDRVPGIGPQLLKRLSDQVTW